MKRAKTSILIQALGFLGAIIGIAISCVEIFHWIISAHPFEATPFFVSGIFIALGALMLQTARADVVAEWIISISKPGGRRKYDPPSGFYYDRKKFDSNEFIRPSNDDEDDGN